MPRRPLAHRHGTEGRSPVAVAFVVPTMFAGGAEHQVYLLMRHLDTSRWRPILVALHGTGPFFERALQDGIEAHCLATGSRAPLRDSVWLSRMFRQERVGIVMSQGFSAATLSRIAGIAARVPGMIVAEHSTGALVSRSIAHRLVERALAPVTSAFVAVAKAQIAYLVEEKGLPRERIRVIHNGIGYGAHSQPDRQRARALLDVPSDAFVVGIVAALRPEKDHLLFLEAARQLAAQLPCCRFAIVGDGSERSKIAEAIAASALAGQVTMYGTRLDVDRLLPGFDVFSLASYTVETFPMAVLEAMGAGLPVVATNVGGLGEMVRHGETGLLVPPRDATSLASAWAMLARDPALRLAMGRAGREYASTEFTIGRMVESYEDLFTEVLGARRRRAPLRTDSRG